MHNITPDMRITFLKVETSLREAFLNVLFQGVEAYILGQDLARLPVKHAGIVIQNKNFSPVEMYHLNGGHIEHSFLPKVHKEFKSSYHPQILKDRWK